MEPDVVTLQLPVSLYNKLQELAALDETDAIDVIARLVTAAHQRRGWLQDLQALREQIRQEGGLQVGSSREEVIERLRQTRREIFEAEYGHLYR